MSKNELKQIFNLVSTFQDKSLAIINNDDAMGWKYARNVMRRMLLNAIVLKKLAKEIHDSGINDFDMTDPDTTIIDHDPKIALKVMQKIDALVLSSVIDCLGKQKAREIVATIQTPSDTKDLVKKANMKNLLRLL